MGKPPLTPDERTEALRMIAAAPIVAEVALAYLLRCLDHSKADKKVYARRHRIKTEEGIEDKVERKRRDPKKIGYVWTDITDIVGLRFITLYRDDIVQVTECVFNALLGMNKKVTQSPFLREQFLEFRFYLANASPDNDPIAIRLKELAARHWRPSDEWKYDGPEIGERYSSVHFVTRVKDSGSRWIPVEIQIRSVFEDAWGEIDHGLLYEPRRLGVPMDWTFQQVERQSNALKKMMDAAADFADTIRNLRAPESTPTFETRPTLDGSHYIGEICRLISATPEIENSLMTLLGRKAELDLAFEKNDPIAIRADYIKIADSFADFITTHVELSDFFKDENNPDRRQLVYVARMEEADCRLLSYDEQQVPVAIDRLSSVVEEFPGHPMAWFKLAEAYERRMDLQEWGRESEETARIARDAYTRAATEVDHLASKPQRERFFAASKAQEEFIRDHLSRVHAFLIWRAAHLRHAHIELDASSLEATHEALLLTYSALNHVVDHEPRHRLLNSVAYFAAESVDLAAKLGADARLPCSTEKLLELVQELESQAPTEGGEAMRIWDTIGYARFMLEGREVARPAANKVLIAHRDQIARPPRGLPAYIREQEAAAVARALKILGVDNA